MTDKEKLNTILRLRLFCSTERELSQRIGYQLHGNHFNRMKPFQCEAYSARFDKECHDYTMGRLELDRLLKHYERASRFYNRHVAGTLLATNLEWEMPLVGALVGRPAPMEVSKKVDRLVAKFVDGGGDLLQAAILVLIAHGLLPTFANKLRQDVADIVADARSAHALLTAIAHALLTSEELPFLEPQTLDELTMVIDEEEQERDGYLCRLLVLFAAWDVLERIRAVVQPGLLLKVQRSSEPLRVAMPRFWRAEGEPPNVVWEMEALQPEGSYRLTRNEIDTAAGEVRFTDYQLIFTALHNPEFCRVTLLRPGFLHDIILGRTPPPGSLVADYADITYRRSDGAPASLHFLHQGPHTPRPATFRAVEADDDLHYCRRMLDAEGAFPRRDTYPHCAVELLPIEVAATSSALIFAGTDTAFKLDRFDAQGHETIPGIAGLNHTDNYIYAELADGSERRSFLCLDSINCYLDLAELEQFPYFHEISASSEIFN